MRLFVPALALGLAAGAAPAAAQEPAQEPAQAPKHDELSLALARVAANEAFGSAADVALIWQVTEARGQTDAERLSWLRRHSPCATGVLSEQRARRRPGNCRWSRNLSPDLSEPEGWPQLWPWARHRPAWARTLRLADRLVAGATRRRPCPRTPITWGSPRLDDERAQARGLVPIVCGRAHNWGYRRGPRGG
jgi:hypothetical protein